MENIDLTERQIIIGVDLVNEFIEFVAEFDDDTYISDWYDEMEEDWEDDEDEVKETYITFYHYRSDNVGYIGSLEVTASEEMATWTPHETFKSRLENLSTK